MQDKKGTEILIFGTINVTSANERKDTIFNRKANTQAIQEVCLSEGQRQQMCSEAKAHGKVFQGGPTDLEKGKLAVGVGFLTNTF